MANSVLLSLASWDVWPPRRHSWSHLTTTRRQLQRSTHCNNSLIFTCIGHELSVHKCSLYYDVQTGAIWQLYVCVCMYADKCWKCYQLAIRWTSMNLQKSFTKILVLCSNGIYNFNNFLQYFILMKFNYKFSESQSCQNQWFTKYCYTVAVVGAKEYSAIIDSIINTVVTNMVFKWI